MSDHPSTRSSRLAAAKWVGLLAGVAAVSTLHYATPPEYAVLHGIYQRSYYVPIVLAAYWFGVTGGLAAAVLSAVAYAPHIHHAWLHNEPYTVSQYLELVVFLALGVSVGLITSHERRLTNRYRDTAESLERANRELRESAEHLRRADRLSALGQIAASLAHEIRNPLAGVKGALEIVGGRVAAGTAEAEFSAIAANELERLERLVQEFLDYARPRPPRIRRATVSELLGRAASLLNSQAERAGVSLEVRSSPPGPDLAADPEQIEQVLVNIVLNAIQASPHGGRVQVNCRFQGGQCLIDVVDEGPGVSEQARSRIFEPFFTTKERGTGLGLAISQRIVSAHHGEITMIKPDGPGTIVEIRLPLASGTAGAGSA